MQAHTPTMFLMLLMASATLTIAAAVAVRFKERNGMLFWALAMVAQTASYMLLSLRGHLSDGITVYGANLLLSVSIALFVEGLFEFQQRRPPRWLVWSPVLVLAVFFAFLVDRVAERILLSAAIAIVQCAQVLSVLWERRRELAGRGKYTLAFGWVMLMGMYGYRGIATAQHMGEVSFLVVANPRIQAITYLLVSMCLIVISLGLVIMLKEQADARNRDMAMRDELTGLTNRRFLLESLHQNLALAQRAEQPLTVLMIDIDHFKRVNDTFGHLSGDLVLKKLASTLISRVRDQDIIGRLGGEEFLVILPDTATEGACQLAEDLRACIEATPFFGEDGTLIPVTISIGLYERKQRTRQRSDDMIGGADQALYRAKENGRNRVEVFPGGAT